jgi:hypothetical protein
MTRMIVFTAFAAGLFVPASASAQPLDSFAVLSATPGGLGAVTCTNSLVEGNAGSSGSPLSVVQTEGCTIEGAIVAPVSAQVLTDFLSAYNALGSSATYPCTGSLATAYTDTTLTLAPGVYCNVADVTFTRTTLVLAGPSDGSWIFKIGTGGTGALTGTDFSVIASGGGDTCNNNVLWWTADAATLTRSFFVGTIFSGAAITVTGGSLDGRALAKSAVTLTGTNVSSCSAGGPVPSHPSIKVTGGGQIPVPNAGSSGRATFGFNAQPSGTGAKGRFNYVNHVTGLHVNGDVTAIQVIAVYADGSPKTIRFSGTCDGSSPPCLFVVTVEDHGEPGTADTFGVLITGGVTEVRSSRVISRGNIQFHKK